MNSIYLWEAFDHENGYYLLIFCELIRLADECTCKDATAYGNFSFAMDDITSMTCMMCMPLMNMMIMIILELALLGMAMANSLHENMYVNPGPPLHTYFGKWRKLSCSRIFIIKYEFDGNNEWNGLKKSSLANNFCIRCI